MMSNRQQSEDVFNNLPPGDYQYQTLKTSSLEGGRLRVICFSRPDRFNALSPLAYKEWLWAINQAAKDSKVQAALVTGAGPFYSSGNELAPPTPEDYEGILKIRELCEANPKLRALDDELDLEPQHRSLIERGRIGRDLVTSLIHFPKLLVAGANGPAIGYACTTLALFDFVYAADNSWFQTPFMQWGFCAEGCSSVLFPRILGPRHAHQMLYLGKKYSAKEMLELGFVTELLPVTYFHNDVIALVGKLVKSLPRVAFPKTKALVRGTLVEELDRANSREMNLLIERMASEECAERVMQFFTKKQKNAKL